MHFLNTIDLADVLDITLVAMLIYAGLMWFKKTRAFLVAVGIVFLGVIYAAARYFNLFLTTAILQGFFAVLLIAIIVIFQEELRRFFERIALWGLGRHKEFRSTAFLGSIVRSSVDFARVKTGALMVLEGIDPVERHIGGGVELQGRPSEPLLKSIFDSSSPGHDGAVIIQNGKVSRFAVHLPLSKNLQKLKGLGTRHAAALGLAELCDAMCIVVSEERGVVSIARDGDLYKIEDIETLGTIVDEYVKEKFPKREGKRWVNFFLKNKAQKLTAIVLSLCLWAVFAYKAKHP